MKVQRVKVHLTNGEVADIKLLTNDVFKWIDTVSVNGIKTNEQYIPHHSITYIEIDNSKNDDNDNGDVITEGEPENEGHFQTELD